MLAWNVLMPGARHTYQMTDNLSQHIRDIAMSLVSSLSTLSEEDRDKVLFIASGGRHIRPPNWSTNSRAGYYEEKYALWLKKDLDHMILAPKSQICLYTCAKYHLTRRSLQNRIMQAWSYLIDFLDENKKYADLRTQIRVGKHDEGICLEWKKDRGIVKADSVLEPEFREEKIAQEAPWRIAVDNFLENAKENDKLDIRVHITQEQVDWLTDQYLVGMEDTMVWTITKGRIYLIKNKDLAKAVKDLGLKPNIKVLSETGQ